MTNTSLLIEIQDLYFLKQYDEILKLIEFQLEIEPNNGPYRAWKALCLFKKGDINNAKNIIEQILRKEPHQEDTIRIRGLIKELQGDIDSALQDYNEAIQLNPNFSLAYNSRGGLYADKNEYDAALSDFSEAIRLDPDFSFAYHNRGSVYYNTDDFHAAIQDYDKAISLNPKLVMTYCFRGRAHTYTNAYAAALRDYSEAIHLDPNLAVAYNERGLLFLKEGEIDNAIQDFNEALRINPNYAAAYCNRGRAFDSKGDFKSANQDFSKAIHLDPRYEIINTYRPTRIDMSEKGQDSNIKNYVAPNHISQQKEIKQKDESALSPREEQIIKILSERSQLNNQNLKRLQADDLETQFCLDQIYKIVKDRIIPSLQYETLIDYWLVLLNWGQKNSVSHNYRGNSFQIHKENSGVGLLALTDHSIWIVNDGKSSKKVLRKSGRLLKSALALTGYLDKSKVEEKDLFFQFPHSTIQSIQQNNGDIILKTDQDTWSITVLEPDDIVYPALSLAYQNGIRLLF